METIHRISERLNPLIKNQKGGSASEA